MSLNPIIKVNEKTVGSDIALVDAEHQADGLCATESRGLYYASSKIQLRNKECVDGLLIVVNDTYRTGREYALPTMNGLASK